MHFASAANEGGVSSGVSLETIHHPGSGMGVRRQQYL